MQIPSDLLTISLSAPPRIHTILLVNVPQPHSFECPSTKRWGLDILDCHGRIEVVDRGLDLELNPGQMIVTPPGSHILADFPSGRRSYFASFETDDESPADETISVLLDLREHRTKLEEAMRRAERYWIVQPSRGTQMIWGVLLELAELTRRPAAPSFHPVVTEALEWIEHRSGEPFAVSEVAEAVGVGRTALSRLFRRHIGQTVVEYIRRLRVRRAEAMLTQTNLPIKEIAIRIGLPDAQHFNKTIRRTLGLSPSAIRTRSREIPKH